MRQDIELVDGEKILRGYNRDESGYDNSYKRIGGPPALNWLVNEFQYTETSNYSYRWQERSTDTGPIYSWAFYSKLASNGSVNTLVGPTGLVMHETLSHGYGNEPGIDYSTPPNTPTGGNIYRTTTIGPNLVEVTTYGFAPSWYVNHHIYEHIIIPLAPPMELVTVTTINPGGSEGYRGGYEAGQSGLRCIGGKTVQTISGALLLLSNSSTTNEVANIPQEYKPPTRAFP